MAKKSNKANSKPTYFANINLNKINEAIQAKKEEVEAVVIEQLCYIGEQCVKKAREVGSYEDRTGNLRSSIGYVVTKGGQVLMQGVPVKTKKGDSGVAEGEALLKKLMMKYNKGITLIVVAGMNYAVYVETIHGKDVLTSAELEKDKLVKELLSDLFE